MRTDYGFDLPRNVQIEFSKTVQTHTDETGVEVQPAALWEAFEQEYLTPGGAFSLIETHASETADGGTRITAKIADGETTHEITGSGNGPIDAFISALRTGLGIEASVRDYHEHATTTGANSAAVAYVELEIAGNPVYGIARDANIVTASLRAIVSGLNRASRKAPITRAVASV